MNKYLTFAVTSVALFSFLLFACENKADSKSSENVKTEPQKKLAIDNNPKTQPQQDDQADYVAIVPDKVIAYYFHGNFRCPTCNKMEALAEKIIKERFAEELASGKLEWKPVNVDLEENRHFTQDYNLFTKSLILSAIKDGSQIKWKNCEKIWQHVRNPPEYEDYVSDEIKEYFGGI